MDFVVYEVIKPVLKPSEQMKFLQDNGFITVRNETKKDITNEMQKNSKMVVTKISTKVHQ